MSTPVISTEIERSSFTPTYFPDINGIEYTLQNFTNAVLTNDGSADIVITNYKGQTYNLKAGEIFTWNDRVRGYYPVNIDCTASTGRLAYNS